MIGIRPSSAFRCHSVMPGFEKKFSELCNQDRGPKGQERGEVPKLNLAHSSWKNYLASGELLSVSMNRVNSEVSQQVCVVFEFRRWCPQQISSVEHAIMSAISSPNSSSSIDNRNLNIFPYKLNLLTKLNQSVQRCRALSNMQRLRAALHCSAALWLQNWN